MFDGCSSVTNIDFPNLTTIGNGAASLHSYGSYMFNGMTKLVQVSMPKLISMFGSSTANDTCWALFANCTSLEEIEFPELQNIGNPLYSGYYHGLGNMFQNCYKLRSARFPSLKYLAIYGNTQHSHAMFANCYVLKDLQMPALEELSQASAYSYCNSLCLNCYELEEVSLPSLKSIWRTCRWLFSQCPKLKKVSMPSLTYSNNNSDNKNGTKGLQEMFYMCPALTDVTFGFKGSELISYPTFSSCASQNVVFHCPADAPYNVDVMYLNNAWTVVTNGTFKLIDSIKGTGTQYINTGYTHGTNTLVEIDFALCPID